MTNAWTWWEKSKATVFPASSSWLNFRVRGQFEIKILIVRHINTTYFIWIKKKIKLELAIIWKPVPCQRLTSKNTWPRWVDIWARDSLKWYWSADTLFWQLSIDHNIDVQYVYQFSCAPIPDYNPGQNLLREIAKMPIFSCRPGKNWNHRQMNARFPSSPYPKLFRIAWQLYTLVFRPRQLWIGGGEGVYFLCLGETGVGCKS